MSAALHLARAEHIEKLLPLVAAFHAEEGISQEDATRRAALMPLLEGSPLGAVYLIGPTRAPIGYIVVTFGWSIEFGGMDSFVDELFIRPAVRGRGIATEVLIALPKALSEAGVRAVHLEVDRDNDVGHRLYTKTGFQGRDRYMLMTRKL
ncbi:GNAT family N-acetyltransferase [Shimia thalassica]|jgi:ribosomal protein S18 acetylase RimI-like enzyme|uniref:GNAT family N-acetyltransferase n=1 Tax=Shimia thalassica TaxID=1715693 RepID=UPI0026E2A80C|nr:GNAT family N-acetyltransferase [Shimia thalassica]MDO6480680.1 GNAT family N-acetyltransferase [Shimia thalassica]MDO6521445.1 GNAT family N-acetyltransferase [Shimia thalassica]MDO6799330.1 GNAT family N-acetyltransferase [Shimia thalassica]MDP2495162.1 GNAT family N-acetyltransferase [Shimia thalassica]